MSSVDAYFSLYTDGFVNGPGRNPILRGFNDDYLGALGGINRNAQAIIKRYTTQIFVPAQVATSEKEFHDKFIIDKKEINLREKPGKPLDPKTALCIRAVDKFLELLIPKKEEPKPFPIQLVIPPTRKIPPPPKAPNKIPEVNACVDKAFPASPKLNSFPLQALMKKKSLPIELWTKIHTFLPYKDWIDFVDQTRPLFRIPRPDILNGFLKAIFQWHPHVFDTLPTADLTREMMLRTNYKPTRLVKRQVDLGDKGLGTIAKQGENLTNLQLFKSHFSIEAFDNLLQSCPKIESIELNEIPSKEFDTFIALIAHRLPHLKSLKVVNCPHMTDQSLYSLAIKNSLHSFEYVSTAQESSLSDYGFVPFVSNSQLSSFKIRGCPQVTSATVSVLLTKGQFISQLGLVNCGFDESIFSVIGDQCPNLEMLELGFVDQDINYEDFSSLQNCTELRSFTISDASTFKESTLEEVLPYWQQLETLKIIRCHHITSSFMDSLSEEINPDLHTLKFEPVQSKEIPPSPTLTQESNYNNFTIESLDLTDCIVSKEDLIQFIQAQSDQLKHLRLCRCGIDLDDEVLEKLATCHKLISLEIETDSTSDFKFTDNGIEKLAKHCPQLQILHLKSTTPLITPSLTIKCLQALADYALRLIHLDLSNLVLDENAPLAPLTYFKKRCLNLIHFVLNYSKLSKEQSQLLFSN